MSNFSGFILINKPSGPTSHDVINQLRRITGMRQIGHAGTLDPFASGLLLVGMGETTKLLRHYMGLDKKYEAVLRLRATSDTYDRTGKITNNRSLTNHQIPITKIRGVLKSFIGKQKQIPPMYSAKKVGGKKLYELARTGQNIERQAQDIEIYDIKILPIRQGRTVIPNYLKISCHVSSGTYIRSLVHDIGQRLGCGAYLEELKRTAIGEFKLEDAISIRHPERSESPYSAMNEVEGSHEKSTEHIRQDSSTAASLRSASARNDALKYLIPLKTVLVSGTFDGVHQGHRNYFQQARAYGQRLICIVGRDKIAQKIKGKKPRHSEKERVRFVKQCPEIDRVYLGVDGSEQKIYDFTAWLKPDVIALGYDQKAYTENLAQEMEKRGLLVKIVRLKPYFPKKYKSSLMNAKGLT